MGTRRGPPDPNAEPTRPSHWILQARGADHVARRRHVWGLLGWYHATVIARNRGLAGFLRRTYLRLFGERVLVPDLEKIQPEDLLPDAKVPMKRVNIELIAFVDPWQEMYLKQAWHAIQAEPEPDDDPDMPVAQVEVVKA